MHVGDGGYSEAQVVGILEKCELGIAMPELCRQQKCIRQN
jgi:hypothetical protein